MPKPNTAVRFGGAGTRVSLALCGAIALALTASSYGALWLLSPREAYVYQVLAERGAIPYATVFLFWWGMAILALKQPKVRREWKAFDLQLLPPGEDAYIRQEDARAILQRIRELPDESRDLLLSHRIEQALTRLKLLGSAEKVDDLLQYQGEMDHNDMTASFAAVRAFLAAIPMLGFLGTVLGISQAIVEFQGVFASAAGFDALKQAMPSVTHSLGVAFDTTLVALVLSVVLLFALSAAQDAEDRLLGAIEAYCFDRVLNRIYIGEKDADRIERAVRRAAERVIEAVEARSAPAAQ